ncbi:MAG: hypothetical protein ACLQVM_19350 [Terriglobia bacterium]
MKKTVVAALLLFFCSGWNTPGQQSGGIKISVQGGDPVQGAMEKKEQPGQPLTNESIMRLVKIGFSDETIISMVEHEPGNYSLGAEAVIALKKAGVSEKIIRAMLSKSAGGQGPATVAPVSAVPAAATVLRAEGPAVSQDKPSPEPPAGQDARVPTEPGLYAMGQGGNLQRVEGRVTSFVRSGSRLASTATLGIHANRANTQIPGTHASVTVSPNPTFYYRQVEDEGGLDLILTRLTVKAKFPMFN